ncbi:uncharacterized protein LOC115920035 [Strongylocentrotus purpuratus]|uniref:Cystatin domain-containing protein n=1 Tax=Strongylocentrotus purpuratus TaxID=7668 RepID=A0A7M7N5D1_STRPU|nr:uncharacterized protein LOC115920035 [Strongylocentrotus purpuratus]
MSQEQEKIPEQMTPMCGGWTKVPDGEVKNLQGLLDQVREAAQVIAKRTFTALEPLSGSSQVVAGYNYRIRAYTGNGPNGDFAIFEPPGNGEVSLTSYRDEPTT